MPEVSAIIPAYNRCEYLGRALNSVLAQTALPDEIIVIDDGSTDATGLLMDEYRRGHDRIRYIRQENRGVASARNRGILEARNQTIAFLDSDDTWAPNHIEDALQCFDTLQETGCLFAKYQLVCPDGLFSAADIKRKARVQERAKEIAARFSDTNYYLLDGARCLHDMVMANMSFLTSTMVINWDRFPQKILLDENLGFGEDVDFMLNLLATGVQAAYIDSPHSEYFIHGSNMVITSTDNKFKELKKRQAAIKSNEKKLVYCRTKEEYDSVFERLSSIYRTVADGLCDTGKCSEAAKWFELSFRLGKGLGGFKHILFYKLLGPKYYRRLCILIGSLQRGNGAA